MISVFVAKPDRSWCDLRSQEKAGEVIIWASQLDRAGSDVAGFERRRDNRCRK
jgi:hypothetical protein